MIHFQTYCTHQGQGTNNFLFLVSKEKSFIDKSCFLLKFRSFGEILIFTKNHKMEYIEWVILRILFVEILTILFLHDAVFATENLIRHLGPKFGHFR